MDTNYTPIYAHSTQIVFQHGFPDKDRVAAAELYDQAFGAKFAAAIPYKLQRVRYLARTFCSEYCFTAYRSHELVGLAGFHDKTGSLTGGITYWSLLRHLGLLRGHWAAFVFSFYEHTLPHDALVMDGIAVSENARGFGIGTQLLRQLFKHATKEGYLAVQLDVIEGNERAKKLYEREGFIVTEESKFEYLRWLLRFGASSKMVRTVGQELSASIVEQH